MDRECGRARAAELLEHAATWFKGELARQRWHTMPADADVDFDRVAEDSPR